MTEREKAERAAIRMLQRDTAIRPGQFQWPEVLGLVTDLILKHRRALRAERRLREELLDEYERMVDERDAVIAQLRAGEK